MKEDEDARLLWPDPEDKPAHPAGPTGKKNKSSSSYFVLLLFLFSLFYLFYFKSSFFFWFFSFFCLLYNDNCSNRFAATVKLLVLRGVRWPASGLRALSTTTATLWCCRLHRICSSTQFRLPPCCSPTSCQASQHRCSVRGCRYASEMFRASKCKVS